MIDFLVLEEEWTVSTWHKIGQIERHGEGVRLLFMDPFGGQHVVYLTRQEVVKITKDRMPGDLCTVTETANEVIVSNIGKAWRSRSGRALMIRVPCLAGAEAMAPWKAFCAVLEGRQQAAPLSVLEQGKPAPQAHSALTEGLKAGF